MSLNVKKIQTNTKIGTFFTEPAGLKAKAPKVEKQTLSQEDSKASKAFMNYFKASQAVQPNFSGHSCSTSNFKVKQQPDIPCACCGKPMMISEERSEFKQKAAQAKGQELADLLNKNMEFFRPEEKAVAFFIANEAPKKPEKTINQVVRESDKKWEEIVTDQQKNLLNQVSAKSVELYGEENPVQKMVAKKSKEIGSTNIMDRKNFLKTLDKTTKALGDEEKGGQLMDIAISLPIRVKEIREMMCGGKDIAGRLVQSAMPTAEHIHPKSQGGPNHTSNYMGECAECNNNRGTIPLDEWMQEYPNMPRSSQRYTDEVTERIAKGDLGAWYDDYPVDLKETLARETEGVIQLKVKTPEEIDKMREEKGYTKPDKKTAKTPEQEDKELKEKFEKQAQERDKAKADKAENKPQVQTTGKSKGKGKKGKHKGKRHLTAAVA